MTNVSAIFDRQSQADFAYAALLRDGFTHDDISLLVSEDGAKSFFKNNAPTNELVDEGLGGAAAGVGLGALIGSFLSIGTIFIPGVTLLAIGPIAAVLMGAEAGAVFGGLSGLINADLESKKTEYDEALKAGKAVLIVHTESDGERSRAQAVFNESTARVQRVA